MDATMFGMDKWWAGRPCYYCGLPAETQDHVIPKSLIEQYRLSDPVSVHALFAHGRTRVVPACTQCNSIAGARYHETLADRKAYVKQRLRSKYAKLLAMPDWTEEELAEVGPGLREYIHQGIETRKLIEQRLRW
jgi:hypothetical protein